ncbi:secretion activator protein [Roseibium sp. TrichSKD4]|uniref:glycoside hydrolase family 108 protein n=1 Tax=Roseibium sp. TrichSKD4 TaxID=744980 RepID=UPI0001E575A5|nr:glycosyl hydrolase 108 family protein [Roseibium sp. TrichSKD4]EFO30912.1 secretion activator protein [Roseibium sp. TrichSKD4]
MALKTLFFSLSMCCFRGRVCHHPKDPAGNNRGVIQRTYDAHRRRMGLPVQSVRHITDDEVRAIYREQYWNAVAGDQLPAGVDYAVFDYAVNSGPRRAIKELQRVVGAKPDGIIGNETLSKVGEAVEATVIVNLCEQRMRFVRGLRHWPIFGKGWTRRIVGQFEGAQDDDTGVLDRATLMARRALPANKNVPIPAPKAAAPGKALEEDISAVTVASEVAKDPKWLGILGAFGSTLATVATSSGPIAWAVAAVLIGGGIYLVYRTERGQLTT